MTIEGNRVLCKGGEVVYSTGKNLVPGQQTKIFMTSLDAETEAYCLDNCTEVCQARDNLEKVKRKVMNVVANKIDAEE